MALKRKRRQKHLEPGFDWEDEPLGEVSDAEIGRFLGTSASTVQYQRVRLGIEGKPNRGKRRTYVEYHRDIMIAEAVNWYDRGSLDRESAVDLFLAIKAYKRALEG